MNSLSIDFAQALRRLWATPWFTLFATVTLAVGIAVTTAAYSVVDTLLWKPFAVRDPDNVLRVTQAGRAYGVMSWGDFNEFVRQQTTFSSVGASERRLASFGSEGFVDVVPLEVVNGKYFSTLDAVPLVGRLIQTADEEAGALPVVVLGESFWRRRFHADPEAIGRTVRIAGDSVEVVGVVGSDFLGFGFDRLVGASAWLSVRSAPLVGRDGEASSRTIRREALSVKGHLAEGVSRAMAASEVALIGQRLEQYDTAPAPFRQRRWSVVSNEELTLGPALPIGSLFMLIVSLVLLVACSNLANLAMARGTARVQELSVRTALGASRWRLVREQFVENGLIVLAGGGLATVLLWITMAYLPAEIPSSVAGGLLVGVPFEPELSASVLAIAVGATSLSFGMFGLWPALQLTRSQSLPSLGAGTHAIRTGWKSNRRLVALQVTCAVALWLVAAVCVRVLAGAAVHDSGIDLDRLGIVQVDFALNGRDEASARRLVEAIVADAHTQPGIDRLAASVGLPLGLPSTSTLITAAERPFSRLESGKLAQLTAGTPNIFATLGVRVLQGRGFDERDDGGSPPVAILPQYTARVIFGSVDPVGRAILIRQGLTSQPADTRATVVGIASDTDVLLIGGRGGLAVYVPFVQHYRPNVTFTVRTGGNPAAAAAVLRSVIRRIDPDLAVSGAGAGRRMLEGPFAVLRIVVMVVGGLGSLTLVLAMTGLFGVLSHAVARRSRELGLRMALGADRRQVVRLVIAQGFGPVLDGLVLGSIAGTLGRLVLRATLAVDVAVFDPVSLLLLVPLAGAATAACVLPARRAASLDPNVALREL